MIDIGHTVGNYDVTAKLGEGGMGIVYLVEHPVIGRKAALKAIHPQFARSAEVISRFITEAKAVNQIGHRHIVDITDFGTTSAGDFYFIMELLEGHSLADSIQAAHGFPLARALRIATQIADALQASHDHGVIHRDLKPDNIFLIEHDGDEDFVKVLDFGLAKLVDPDGTPTHDTRKGAIMGTPYYMAPEQCEGNAVIDHRADVYALGVVLFEMLTGKLPFGGTGYGEVILKHMTMPPPAARSIVPTLPRAIDAVLFRALAKDPADRFQTMAELRAALLDPEAFAVAMPELDPRDNLAGRIRAAVPMTRSEMTRRATLISLPTVGPRPRTERSTLRDGVGEIADVADVAADAALDRVPRTHYGRALTFVAFAGIVVAVVMTTSYERPAARILAAAQAFSRPATVRVNFSSDPDGATVLRPDGSELGVTPLSTEVPYGDDAAEYVFHKEGFIDKRVALVPNMPSPIFAVLRIDELPDPPVPVDAPVAVASPAATTGERLSARKARAARHLARAMSGEPVGDETFQATVQ